MLEENLKCLFLKIIDDYLPENIESYGCDPIKFIYNILGTKIEIAYNPFIVNEKVIKPINWEEPIPGILNFTPRKEATQPQFILLIDKFEYSVPKLSRIELAKVQDKLEEVYRNFAESQIANILNSILYE